jgi:prepilin-type N-terminal cleavage/methylation domain-containing protein
MNSNSKRSAFTLIELLTVMAIITLLIGILTPALGAARDNARKTAIKAQLNAMEVGLESFHGDEGKYPPSNANFYAKDPSNPATTDLTDLWEVANSQTVLMQGAQLLVDALVGRDLLGYDPRAGTVLGAGSPNVESRWDSQRDRRQPYIPVDGVDLSSADKLPEDGYGKVPIVATTNGEPQPTIDTLLCRVFKDKFGWPILYYRASATATQNTPIVQTGQNSQANFYGDGVFDGVDNAVFTSYLACTAGAQPPSAPGAHRICDANQDLALTGAPPAYPTGLTSLQNTHRFAEYIRSLRATTYDTTQNPPTIKWPRAVKADRFILLSAGKDGIYGTLDDVANFQALSVER